MTVGCRYPRCLWRPVCPCRPQDDPQVMDSGRPGVSDEKNAGCNSLKCDPYISWCIAFLNPDRFSKIAPVPVHFSLSAIHLVFIYMSGLSATLLLSSRAISVTRAPVAIN